jgi:FAD/FMN-containing dehydrogenase
MEHDAISNMGSTYSRYPESALRLLQTQLQGSVIAGDDERYNAARQAWDLTVDQHPALIVAAQTAADVAAAVRFAAAHGLEVAVQATGHGVIRPADGSLLILTSGLNEIQVNPQFQSAWIGAGAKWGMVLEKTQAFGLTPLLGSSPDVGAVGYTLGGGLGWLARKYGLAIDSVKVFELVTATGELVRASESENSELFWGLRGGGGGFGVITGMEMQLHPVEMVYGGNLIFPIEQAKTVFSRYREWIEAAPDELTSSMVIMNFPPLPVVPEFLRGKSVAMVRGCYCGPLEQGEAVMKFWRDGQPPVMIDDFKAMPFSQVSTISNDPVDPIASKATGMWMGDISDETLELLIELARPPLISAEVRHAGGAIAHVDPQTCAYSHRSEQYLLSLIGMTPNLEEQNAFAQQAARIAKALKPHLNGKVYMNFLGGAEARERTRDGFSAEAYRRLQAIKAKYDPDNRFNHSYAIPPAA